MVREEIRDKCLCILVDEAQNISKREQMAIILRFVSNHGILTERFFVIKSVSDTTSVNLKKEISNVLVYHDLQDVGVVWEFFSHLDNIVTSSTKRIAELHDAQINEIKNLLASGERDSGTGANQFPNLQRAGVTRWSFHYDSIKNLISMYTATCKVFEVLSDHSLNERAKSEVRGIYRNMGSFEFVFILHLMYKIMRTTYTLCKILQIKSQDILTVITFFTTTKTILQELRECGWEKYLHEVKVFCSRNEIDVYDLYCLYKIGRSRQTTIEHHYHFDVFSATINYILMKLNTRFNESSVELLSFSTTLDPKNSSDLFNNDDICKLATKFYPGDFTDQDIVALEYE
ncbi:uncharacterized protein [Primulina huaijiensis]|uniref:uncharacterized protein n=1 Tax=Primulina huaijiensis TaxID=1492673 RepID=UPI003CC6F732